MKKLKVLIEARPFCVFDAGPMEILKNSGMEIIDMRGSGIENPDFMKAVAQTDAILAGNDITINDDLLEKAPNLKIIAKMGVGLDAIDIPAATRHNVIVCNTPGVNNQAVADHTFALILGVARKIVFCHQSLRDGRWEHTKIMGLEIWQKTLGLIGLGAIGRYVALRAKGFNMKVVAYDPYWPKEFAAEHNIQSVEIDELLKISDIVSIHSPLTPENKGMINKDAFTKMKSSAILINAARGGIVDEDDLCEAVKNKAIAGAGIDVFQDEPPTDSPMLQYDEILLTPHTAAFTHEAMNNMNTGTVDQLIEYFNDKNPANTVNPEVYEK